MSSKALHLYVGTYTLPMSFVKGKGKGIYTCIFDTSSGKLEIIAETAAPNPSYLALHPNGKYLYAVNELCEKGKPTEDAISAYGLDPENGIPVFLNRQPSRGASPCHVSIEPSGRFVYMATYVGGDVAAYPIDDNGWLGEISDHIQQRGEGKTAHAHSITPAPAGDFALVCDLGLDRVIVYRLDLKSGGLIPHSELALETGSGPRHLDFHPNGRFVYVINELNGTLTALAWNASAGKVETIKTLSTLPRDFSGPGWCADIHVHPNGRFVYGSNRGNHSLVIYEVDEASGELRWLGFESTRGKTPRNFVIDPHGEWLLVANQDSDEVTVFHIDTQSGLLEYQARMEILTPVCLKFAS